MGVFQNWPTREKRDFGAKNNKETYSFLKRRIFSSCTGRKSGVFRSCQGQNWEGGLPVAHNRTVPGLFHDFLLHVFYLHYVL